MKLNELWGQTPDRYIIKYFEHHIAGEVQLKVHYDFDPYQPESRTDPSWDADATITSVTYQGKEVMDQMDDNWLDEARIEALEHENSPKEDDRY